MEEISLIKRSMKIIKTQLISTSDILGYLKEEKILKNAIINIFGDFSQKIQCTIACFHMEGEDGLIRDFGDEILEEMKMNDSYDLLKFLELVYLKVFPANMSTLMLKYEDLRQEDLSIVMFSRDIEILTKRMGLKIENQKYKFIFGLSNTKLKKAMLRNSVEGCSFKKLVHSAIDIEMNLMGENDEKVEEKIAQSKEVKLEGPAKYFRLAVEKNLKKGLCYNCMTEFHACSKCPVSVCKFCKKDTGKVKHFSLGCPDCPERL